VGFVAYKAALGQVFSEYFGFPANHSTNFSIIVITRGWHNRPISVRSAGWTQLDSTPTIPIVVVVVLVVVVVIIIIIIIIIIRAESRC
jgi:hypothetical protein